MILVGWKFTNPDIKIASVRIRGLNIIDQINKMSCGVKMEFFMPENINKYNIVIFSKSYSESDLSLARALKNNKILVFFDICDNHFLLDDNRVKLLVEMLSLADKITVSTSALKTAFVQKGISDNKVFVIPDAIDEYKSQDIGFFKRWIENFRFKYFRKKLENFFLEKKHRIIWFGNHEGSISDSGMAHLGKLQGLLSELNKKTPISLTILSNSKSKFKKIFSKWSVPCFYYEWSLQTQRDVLGLHGIAIIPIEINDFTLVKTNNRVLTAILNGLNVVADEIPSYREFKDCIYLNNWETGLRTYLSDEKKREYDLNKAIELIQNKYNLPKIAEEWLKIVS